MQKRITIFDTVRGFTMISMAGFHACYDLAYLYGWDMPWFTQSVLSRHLARQHQLGIFVYRGLDVHALTQQCQTSG